MYKNKKEYVFSVPKTILDLKNSYDYPIYKKTDKNSFEVLVSKESLYHKSSCIFYSKEELKSVFINTKDKNKYYFDIESHISNIIKDENVCLNIKATLLNEVAKHTINNLFEKELSLESLKSVDKILSNNIDFILKDELALKEMINVISYDYYTSTHCIDVATYAIAFGVYLNLNKEDLKLLGKGALLHDIGKKNIKREIICKEGPLSKEEFDEVKKHPSYSAEILMKYGENDIRLLNIVEQHHEKCNGKGYPKGLHSDEIDDFAKIVSICDIFNALTTKRTYKKKIAKYEAIMIMLEDMKGSICDNYLNKFIKFLNHI